MFEGVQLRLHSPLAPVAAVAHRRRAAARCACIPNFAPLTRFALFSAEQASRLVGAHLKRRRGEGTDFHQMREYRVGDSLRQIDWKATSRCAQADLARIPGREEPAAGDDARHRPPHDGAATASWRISTTCSNAALVVSYLALRQGDAVGLLASGGDQRWVAPQRGMAAIDTLLRATYDLQPQPVATDYLAAATELCAAPARGARW